jgi:predicted DNA-binding transcriptional regulator AlpA
MKTATAAAELWVSTGRAIEASGLSRRTLWRWINEGILVEGTHYRHGLTGKSPMRWNPKAIEARIQSFRQLPSRPLAEIEA